MHLDRILNWASPLVHKNISAIIRIYRRILKYISDYQNISAQLKIYQRLLKYIDLPTETDNK